MTLTKTMLQRFSYNGMNYSTKVVSTLKDKLYQHKSHYCRFLSHSSIRDGFLLNVHDNNNNRIERRSFMSSSLKEFPDVDQKELLYQQQEILINDATKLSLSLYRMIVRSLRIIKISNEYDEVEFQRREIEQLEQLEMKKSSTSNNNNKNDTRYDMISMLPPVNRIDELRSRYEYYSQYTREQYYSEINCLNPSIHNYHHNRNNHRNNNINNNGMDILLWNNQQMIEKFILILKRGNEQRQWLLRDMKYNIDPYEIYYNTIYKPQYQLFEKNAIEFIHKVQQQQSMMDNNDNDISSMNHTNSRAITQKEKQQQNHHHDIENKDDNDNDGWNTSDDEDDDVRTLPPWYKNPRSQ